MKKSVIKRSARLAWITAILSILLCGVFSFTYFSLQEYAVFDGIRFTKEECQQAKGLIEEIYAGKPSSVLFLEELSVNEYVLVLRQVQEDRRVIINQKVYGEEMVEEVLNRYPYSMEQAATRLNILKLCDRRLSDANGYGSYIGKIHENLKNYKEVHLFPTGIKNLFVKANKDFYGLEEIKLRACVDAGILKYLDGKAGLFVGFIFAIAGAMIFMLQFREGKAGESLSLSQGNSVWWYVSAMLFGAVGICLAEAAAAHVTWDLEELFRPLQSIDRFRSCPELLSVAMLLGIRIFFRCLGVMTVFFLCIFLFSLKKKWLTVLLGTAFLLTEIILDQKENPFTLYGQGFAENCFGTYRNVILFDRPIPAGIIFSVIAVLMFLCAAFMAARQIRVLRVEARERAERQYFEQVDEKYTQARILRHDMNNHLSAVAMLLKEGKTTDAQEYLMSVMEELEATKPPVRTGIGVLDAVLMSKDAKAKEMGVALTMEFDPVLQRVSLPDYELCSLFGNLLDNCLEACEGLPEKDRWARLKVTRQMDMICIFSENPYGEIKKENGRIVTHKADGTSHGLGLRQMERIAAKHGGTMEIETKNHVFAVSILFSTEET